MSHDDKYFGDALFYVEGLYHNPRKLLEPYTTEYDVCLLNPSLSDVDVVDAVCSLPMLDFV